MGLLRIVRVLVVLLGTLMFCGFCGSAKAAILRGEQNSGRRDEGLPIEWPELGWQDGTDSKVLGESVPIYRCVNGTDGHISRKEASVSFLVTIQEIP